MKIYYCIIILLLVPLFDLFGQKSKYPKDITANVGIVESGRDKRVKISCSKLPIDLYGPKGEGEILIACKNKNKFNLIYKSETKKGTEYLTLVTANKEKSKWRQIYGAGIQAPLKNKSGKPKLIDCFFADMNTAILIYEMKDGGKEGVLLRITSHSADWYTPNFDMNTVYEDLPRIVIEKFLANPRPKY